nr:hypothetical protein [uncultured Duodenibacillus sp.]
MFDLNDNNIFAVNFFTAAIDARHHVRRDRIPQCILNLKNGTVRIRDSAGSPVILDTDIQISSLRVGKRDNRCLDVIDIMPLKFSIQTFPTHIRTKLQIQRSNFRSFRQTNNIIMI